jgi:hypothetical protein
MRYLSLLIGLLSVCIAITSQAQNVKTLDDPNVEVWIFRDRVQITNTSPVDVVIIYGTVVIGQRANNRCPQPMCAAFILDGNYEPFIDHDSFGNPKQGLREKVGGGNFIFACTVPARNSVALRALVVGFGDVSATRNLPDDVVYKRANRRLSEKQCYKIYLLLSGLQKAIDASVAKEEAAKSDLGVSVLLQAFCDGKFPEYKELQSVLSIDAYKKMETNFNNFNRIYEDMYKQVVCN